MTSKCKFHGPAQIEFSSFEEHALFSLNNSCPRWNDNNDPRSYIIPPIFYFKHPERPDHEAIREARNRVVVHRTSDDAEHIVFDALKTLINEGFSAPIVALHDFNIDRVSAHFDDIFPDVPSEQIRKHIFGEYDFLLIGPKIGIVVIEVKSSAFTKTRDFNLLLPQHQQWLPEKYRDGIKQLRSFDVVLNLLELLRVTTSIGTDRKYVRRILFTPNLKRSRFDDWFSSLDEDRRKIVNERSEGINRWFYEDAQPASRLCAKLRSYLLDDCPATRRLHSSVFELYVPILTGLASVTFTKTNIAIDDEALSEMQAVMRVSDCVETQDPRSLDPSYKRRTIDRSSSNQTVDFLKAVILTPEQSASLRGPPNQFIFGAAGTGKTVVLLAKALDLLRKGESVLILCAGFSIYYYEDFFERHNLKGSSVQVWASIRNVLPCNILIYRLKEEKALDYNAARSLVLESLLDPTKTPGLISDYFKAILGYDNILIDDAFAEETCPLREWSLFAVLIIMAYAEQTSHWKTAWIGLDPFAVETFFLSQKQSDEEFNPMHHLSNAIKQFASNTFGITDLSRVMRNPENIFQSFLPKSTNISPFAAPTIGHKIQGSRKFKAVTSFDSLSQEILGLLESVKDKYPLEQIAVILSGDNMIELLGKSLERQNVAWESLFSTTRFNSNISLLDRKPKRGKLAIYEWDEVHSMEWPIVIYITDTRDRRYPEGPYPNIRYRNYLACSRATGMLVQIALDIPDS